MRTTVTLTAEAEALVKKVMAERHLTFKDAVNEAIVRGLSGGQPSEFRTPTRSMGRARLDLDRALQIAGELEDAELRRKMSLGK